ncbi:hypothetical protein J7643_01350 [bacterium]|nr:hypothetical protein [bacterium]
MSQHRVFDALCLLSQELSIATSLHEVLELATHRVNEQLQDAWMTLWLWDPQLAALQLRGRYALSEADVAASNAIAQTERFRRHCTVFQAFDRLEALATTELQGALVTGGSWSPFSAFAACYAVPVVSLRGPLGGLALFAREPFEDTAFVLRALQAMAAQISSAMTQHHLRTELTEKATQLRLTNHQLEHVINELREVDRVKTGFLNAVSHELRTPLATIQGYAELLEDGAAGELSPHQASFVQRISGASFHLKRLVDDLLDLACLNAGKFRLEPRAFNYEALMRDVVGQLQVMSDKKRQTLTLEVAPELPMLEIDPLRLTQVVNNLVSNAIKYTPEGGSVRVRVLLEERMVRTEVRDTGIGIPEEHRGMLFSNFHRVDNRLSREDGGVGLGLAISKGFVEAHGGRIDFSSEPGVGSTFWFELPVPVDAALADR